VSDPRLFAVPAGSRVYLGDPGQEPQQLLDAIALEFAGVPAVREARRVWAVIDDGAPGLVVGIDLDPDAPGARRAGFAAVAGAQVTALAGFSVNVAFVQDQGELVAWMATNAAPFYRRKRPL
jgi:hypothetical protein